jgi:hypothetical protein
MRIAALLIACASLLLGAAPAAAGCSGAGLEREYRAVDVVARVRVMAETRVMDAEPSAATIRQWGDYFRSHFIGCESSRSSRGGPARRSAFSRKSRAAVSMSISITTI